MKKNMDIKNRAEAVCKELEMLYPEAQCSLEYEGEPWKLLIMARLSAQCTDERVNIVCKDLFRRFPTLSSVADCDIAELENVVRPCGLFRTKAASIKAAAQVLVEKHGGNVPDTMEELLELPGVGRKIANLILGDIYKKGGIVADTHCIRISNRLGFAQKRDPLAVEKALTPIIPLEKQSDFCHRLVLFGRDICSARNPRCDDCPLHEKEICKGAADESE